MSGGRLLIVNADDFGFNASATDAILECHVAGSITSTTLMANTPDCERAAALAPAHPDLGVGLHFNLTWGAPLASPDDVRSLLGPDGQFLSRGRLARRLFTGRVVAAHVERELAAQWQRLRSLGCLATHVDSHQHVHGLPIVFDVVAAHCERVGVSMRMPWVAEVESGSLSRRARRTLLRVLLQRAERRWRGRVAWNDSINSIFDLPDASGSEDFSDREYATLLSTAVGPSHELMVHAVNDVLAMEGYTRIGDAAHAEYRYLRQGRLRELAAKFGYVLGNYRNLV